MSLSDWNLPAFSAFLSADELSEHLGSGSSFYYYSMKITFFNLKVKCSHKAGCFIGVALFAVNMYKTDGSLQKFNISKYKDIIR
jgi:hypothetical protein